MTYIPSLPATAFDKSFTFTAARSLLLALRSVVLAVVQLKGCCLDISSIQISSVKGGGENECHNLPPLVIECLAFCEKKASLYVSEQNTKRARSCETCSTDGTTSLSNGRLETADRINVKDLTNAAAARDGTYVFIGIIFFNCANVQK